MTAKTTNYVDQVKSLFGLRRTDEPWSEAAAQGGPYAQPTVPMHSAPQAGQAEVESGKDEFDSKLRHLSSRGDLSNGLFAGRIHMLNTDKIRERMGNRWQRFADRVHSTIKTEIKLRLGPHDLFTQTSPSTYVVAFSDCSEVEARVKMALLSEQILEKLLGEADAKNIEALGVERLIARADGTMGAEALDSAAALNAFLDHAQVSGATAQFYDMADVAAGRRALTPGEVTVLMADADQQMDDIEEDEDEPGGPVVKVDRLRALMRQLEDVEAATMAREPAFERLDGKAPGDGSADDVERAAAWRLIRRIRKRAETQIVFYYDRDPIGAETGADAEVSISIEFSYLPMWYVPSNKVGLYLCNATVLDEGGHPAILDIKDKDREADFRSILDRLALRKVREDLRPTADQNERSVVMVPVHFSTLARSGSRDGFLEICSNFPGELRNAIEWEILGSRADIRNQPLFNVLKSLRPYGRGISIRIDVARSDLGGLRRNLPLLRQRGVTAIGVDVGTIRRPESQRIKILEQLAEVARESHLDCYAHGFDALELTVYAASAGYSYISGSVVATPTKEPRGVHSSAMEKIYERLISRGAVA